MALPVVVCSGQVFPHGQPLQGQVMKWAGPQVMLELLKRSGDVLDSSQETDLLDRSVLPPDTQLKGLRRCQSCRADEVRDDGSGVPVGVVRIRTEFLDHQCPEPAVVRGHSCAVPRAVAVHPGVDLKRQLGPLLPRLRRETPLLRAGQRDLTDVFHLLAVGTRMIGPLPDLLQGVPGPSAGARSAVHGRRIAHGSRGAADTPGRGRYSTVIILDSCPVRGIGLSSNAADVLRAIREVKAERIAVPWMAIEELAAQKALSYKERHATAEKALG